MSSRIELRRDAGRIGPSNGPWIRRKQIARVRGSEDPGELGQLVDYRNETIAWGLYSPASDIALRLLGFGSEPPPEDWLERRIVAAVSARAQHRFPAAGTTAWREVNSEGDGLPGLVVDRYGSDRVVQITTAPMAAREQAILRALSSEGRVFLSYPRTTAKLEGIAPSEQPSEQILEFREHGLTMQVPAPPGQKTGAYLDQRANRRILPRLAQQVGGRFLDLGCHAGGFALNARRDGLEVVAVDSSPQALDIARANAERNGLSGIQFLRADMFAVLDQPELAGEFGMIVADPPKIASRKSDVPKAMPALQRLVDQLAPRVVPGGFLVLCSCSHHIGPDALDFVIASGKTRGFARVLGLGPGIDHPVWPGHREGDYLTVQVYRRSL